ncbi:hypothetical protein EX30DRAFT_363757 [Ascodesmis nigricans]|uniref:Ecp2 effector protein domain-containing protein n=1 Tax=Ascodesmis nigricans TaxID=341454 RepID=A0A4S2MXF5_9PEZI|nr:hypothetical protein EX30DRAFT_363757 [Ascodesmis nigricans]
MKLLSTVLVPLALLATVASTAYVPTTSLTPQPSDGDAVGPVPLLSRYSKRDTHRLYARAEPSNCRKDKDGKRLGHDPFKEIITNFCEEHDGQRVAKGATLTKTMKKSFDVRDELFGTVLPVQIKTNPSVHQDGWLIAKAQHPQLRCKDQFKSIYNKCFIKGERGTHAVGGELKLDWVNLSVVVDKYVNT